MLISHAIEKIDFWLTDVTQERLSVSGQANRKEKRARGMWLVDIYDHPQSLDHAPTTLPIDGPPI